VAHVFPPVGGKQRGKWLKGKDEEDDGDECTLRVANRTEKSGEMEEECVCVRGEEGGGGKGREGEAHFH